MNDEVERFTQARRTILSGYWEIFDSVAQIERMRKNV